jgi:hypothetical protein
MKYEFTVAAMFKNEQHALAEWIEHYLYHGAQHIFLIDDDSNDNSVEIIQKYIRENDGMITLFHANKWPMYLGRQADIYNHFILPLINEKITKWMLICDLDEFMWSPLHVDLKEILKMCSNLSQIQVNHTFFGSSGHISQPSSIVKYFTFREKEPSILLKYFLNSDYNFSSLNVHHATYVNDDDSISTFIKLDNGNEYFVLNHYKIQSLDFWKDVKCTRGDSDNYLIRNVKDFFDSDKNEIGDLGLWEQNKHMPFYKNL